MVTDYVERAASGHVVLDIGDGVGALIVHTTEQLRGREIEASPHGHDWLRTHTAVLERRLGGRTLFAAVFPALPAGAYTIWRNDRSGDEITIAGGAVAELDWRTVGDVTLRLSQAHRDDSRDEPRPAVTLDDLPPRYRRGQAISAAPMGTAPMRYTADGRVAWDQMWTAFCDLALAGGPPHRDAMLEPAAPEEALAAPDAYARVVAEIERGLLLVTGLPTVRSTSPGWVGLRCTGEEMARWLRRAIEVENVRVRCDGAVLYLPAGPHFREEREIKNVVTVVAKTHHYWIEHRTG
jgi:hypothetical protein